MFLVGLISWWYGRGWITQWQRIGQRFSRTLEFFSVGQLVETLFSPFRQIAASGSADKSLGGMARAMLDRLVSRTVGAFIRFFTIIFAAVDIILQAIYAALVLVAWWVVPLLPIAGAILFTLGWVPAWM